MSGLNITHVHRNLHTRVTFLYLEFEDVFVILGIAALTNVFGRFLHREIGGIPLTMRQHEASLHQPAFCELLPIRDYLDNVIVRSNGALVAGYDLGGINSYYHSVETPNQKKISP